LKNLTKFIRLEGKSKPLLLLTICIATCTIALLIILLRQWHPLDSAVSVEPSEVSQAKETLQNFLKLEPGHFSQNDAHSLQSYIESAPSPLLEIAKDYQSSKALDKQLLGYYIELELIGYTPNLESRLLKKHNHILYSSVCSWLYMRHQFREWDSLNDQIASSLAKNQIIELLDYVGNPYGLEKLPPPIYSLNLGTIDPDYLYDIFSRNVQAQRILSQVIVQLPISTVQRNQSLELLKKLNGDLFTLAIDHFIAEAPSNSHTKRYLQHLKSETSQISQDRLTTATNIINSSSDLSNETMQSIGLFIQSAKTNTSVKVESETVERSIEMLSKHPLKTHNLQKTLADLAYVKWLNQP
jgi:hypothetical protein